MAIKTINPVHKNDCKVKPDDSIDISYTRKLELENKKLIDALRYLVETKERVDVIGKDSIAIKRINVGWIKARNVLKSINPKS